MNKSQFTIALRNYAGVPVVELAGQVNEKTLMALKDLLSKLIQAGHYNVMLNLKRAIWEKENLFSYLEAVARLFKRHYGNLDIVVEAGQMAELMGSKSIPRFLRFCGSEGQALGRIRGLPGASVTDVSSVPARLSETKQ